MRPRRVCRGKGPCGSSSATHAGRFNEAPACLPGKVVKPRYRILGPLRFNEAPACLPGKAKQPIRQTLAEARLQ